MKQAEKIAKLKQEYVEYFEQVPVQRYAAMAIGRDEDTIIAWKAKDADFSEAVKRAEAEFIRKKMASVKPDFALERLFKQSFSHKEEVEVQAKIEPIPVAKTGSTSWLREVMMSAFRASLAASKDQDEITIKLPPRSDV